MDALQAEVDALLFLQLIMRKLRRQRPVAAVYDRRNSDEGRRSQTAATARAAVVVPNGTLFGDGVCARIKEELLKEEARAVASPSVLQIQFILSASCSPAVAQGFALRSGPIPC